MVRRYTVALWLILALMVGTAVQAADWPMWRANSNHTAKTSEQLDDSTLQLQWQRQYAAPQPAWDDQQEQDSYGMPGRQVLQRLAFDIAYQPVVAGNVMYVGSMNSDWVAAGRSRDRRRALEVLHRRSRPFRPRGQQREDLFRCRRWLPLLPGHHGQAALEETGWPDQPQGAGQ